MFGRYRIYRIFTWLRKKTPWVISERIPKGRRDCGHHRWYRSDDGTWRCYDCEPGISYGLPWSRAEYISILGECLEHFVEEKWPDDMILEHLLAIDRVVHPVVQLSDTDLGASIAMLQEVGAFIPTKEECK